ncbi:hypothetical protein NDU88_000896 [Pleurodeles waltl]|uniref:Uncharacterized protein n=1 Tax=Pleurodeles waltl TaxID=8319 RepID=A0AAV7SYP0_PLEWA|nr:hypothetical protein NDU88_000896 [Pleurodeles waltl]
MFVAPKPLRKPHPRSGHFRGGLQRGGGDVALCVLRGTGGSGVGSRMSGEPRTPVLGGKGGKERWVAPLRAPRSALRRAVSVLLTRNRNCSGATA